jgi:hypothetical protein
VDAVITSGDKDATAWIMTFRKTLPAWGAGINLIQSPSTSAPAKLLAAQMLAYKACRGPPIRGDGRMKGDQATLLVGQEVRSAVVALFAQFSQVQPFDVLLMTQLATTIAAQVARWPLIWNYDTAMFELAQVCTPVGVAFFLTALPEISTSQRYAGLPPDDRVTYLNVLRGKSSVIHEFFVNVIENSNDPRVQEVCMRGFQKYIECRCVHGSILSSSPLLKGVFEALCFATDERLVQASRDFAIASIESIDETSDEFFDSAHLQHLVGGLMKYVAHPITGSIEQSMVGAKPDNERAFLLVDVLCQASDSIVPATFKNSGDKSAAMQSLMPLFRNLLRATMHFSWNVVRPTLFAWRTIVDHYFPALDGLMQQVTEAIVCAAQYTEEYETTMDAFDRDEYQEYRNDCRDALRYFCDPELRPSTFREVVNIALTHLNSVGSKRGCNWRLLEAGLHGVGALNKFCHENEPALVPLFEGLHSIASELSMNPSIYCSAVILVGQNSHWVRAHPGFVSVAFNIVASSLSIPAGSNEVYPMRLKQNHVGCIAFAKLCEKNARPYFESHPEFFFPLCDQLWTRQLPDMSCSDKVIVLHGLCHLASAVPPSHSLQTIIEGLFLAPLQSILSTAASDIPGESLAYASQSLEVIFTQYRPKCTYNTAEPWHPLCVLQKYWESMKLLLSSTVRHQDEEAADTAHESVCKGIQALLADMDVTKCNKEEYIALEMTIMEGMGQLYVISSRPCYLHVCKLLLELASKYQAGVNLIVSGIIEILQISLNIFGAQGALDNLPSTASKLADMIESLVALHTEFSVSENAAAELIINLLMVGLRAQDTKAGRSFINAAMKCTIVWYKYAVLTIDNALDVRKQRVMEILVPKMMYGLHQAANGLMPPNQLDSVVFAIRSIWEASDHSTMKVWLSIMMTIDSGFPSASTKDTTKQKYIDQIICQECYGSKARFKKLLKSFCGGKKKLKDAARKQRAGNTGNAVEQVQRKNSNANKQKPGIQKVRTETFS